METLWAKILATALAGATGIYKGIPVGFAMGLPTIVVALATSAGAMLMVLILYYSGSKLKNILLNKVKKNTRKQTKFRRLMQKYGIPGLGIIGAGTIGPIPTVLLGIATKQTGQKFLPYLITGILLWTFILSIITGFGIEQASRWLL